MAVGAKSELLRCIYCLQELEQQSNNKGYHCEHCDRSFPRSDGIHDFLGEESETQALFPEEYFDVLSEVEKDHFWFLGRNRLIQQLISNYLSRNSKILEVGCGTGAVSLHLKENGYSSIECGDIFSSAIRYCRSREVASAYYLMDLRYSLFLEHYDAVCIFDVLEHINEDELALKNLYDSVREGGFLFVTVPASTLPWSGADIYTKHKRRYSRRTLVKKVERAGFHVLRCSYFMTLLFPIILTSRLIPGDEGRDTTQGHNDKCPLTRELKLPAALNKAFSSVFSVELHMLKRRDLPLGSSLFCVAQKMPGKGRILSS